MIQPGTVVFQTPDALDAADQAKGFCKTRELNPGNAKIVRKDGFVRVIITAQCVLPAPKKPNVCARCNHLYDADGKCKRCNDG